MDFSVVDPSVDFYVLDFLDINDCSEELRNLGPTPIRGNSETTLVIQYCNLTQPIVLCDLILNIIKFVNCAYACV